MDPSQVPIPDTDEGLNSEFDQLRDELKMVRRQRALLRLRSRLAREEYLLAQERQQHRALRPRSPNEVARSPNPPLETLITRPSSGGLGFDPFEVPAQGIKRSYSEEPLVTPLERPPYLSSTVMLFDGTRPEFRDMLMELQAHFDRYTTYFYSRDAPHRKMEETRRHMSGRLARKWEEYVLGHPERDRWRNFCSFVADFRAEGPVDVAVNPAAHRYNLAMQKPTQTVLDYASHLTQMEHDMGVVYDDEARIFKLWDSLLPEVRAAAPTPESFPGDFRQWIKKLTGIELRIPGRYAVIGPKVEKLSKRQRRL
ncbi:hypothetical protein BO70DRAFT_360439 [Aspergillus heteromorphus CBS 117.55]|uniref:Retrotransposon gag domain-containing protein n=1 Tax=Aspergillus heteromorphus CBS 117.55 TaxID=1448321 RepID=A0A317WLU4_9EURO|nr:uncharacterized protein BO70DRAFT_360439 [Aspergillus heteromorphus CBS 117.55]PWY86661.1 hypothetical protein BO70DRAFT_360439 [Aspergillus heteromorphus CBS 117.55]